MAGNGTASTAGLTSSQLSSVPLPLTSSSFNGPSTVIKTTTTFSTVQASPSSPQPSTSTAPSVTSTSIQPSTPTPTPTPIPAPSSTTQIETTAVVSTPSSSNGTPLPPTTIVITSTAPVAVTPTPTTSKSSISQASSTLSSASVLPGSTGVVEKSTGLSSGGKIAVAVVVPVAAVALIVLAILFFWRKRKQRKDAEELRRKEVEEYGYNPNNDPTLPTVGTVRSNSDEPSEMRETDGAGYRGWGQTSNARKASTTLSSGNGPVGMARSDSGSNPGGYPARSPTTATGPNSEVQSGDPLVGSPNNGRPTTADSETIGALGAAPTSLSNRQDRDIHRGPSNASSAYSGANRSDHSGEGPLPGTAITSGYYNEGIYYDEGVPQHGPYGNGSLGAAQQPVIRDVQARRNTRIENPAVYPPQGNTGIAQNF